jgi:hypothetical protein
MWLLAAPLLLLLPSLNSFPYPASGSSYSDLSISHYPNAFFLKESIINYKQIPLWSPTILSGFPFAANPLSGLWYPPGWLALITPLPLGFNLLIGIHLILGGLGMHSLMKEEGLGHAASLLSGLAFALMPKVFSHYGAGHLTLLFAIPLTPWLLWSQRVYGKPREGKKHLRIPPGLVLGLVFLADVRWGAYAFILWWAYSIFHRRSRWGKLVLNLSSQSILGLLLAAPLLVPLVEYSFLSTRSMLGAEDVLIYSLPIVNLLGLLFPNGEGLHEWVLYSGGIVFLLALSALVSSKWRRNKLFWAGLFLVSVTMSLGSEIPGSKLVAGLPLVSLLRVPSRALFLTGISLAVLAGYGVETIFTASSKDISRKINAILILFVGFSVSLAIGLFILQGEIPKAIIWGSSGLIMSSVWIWLGVNLKKLPVGVWLSGVFIIALLDLGFVDLKSFQGRSSPQVFAEGEAVAQFLSSQSGDFRTYSPSYSIPQQTSVRYGLQMADGVDPLQFGEYVQFMDEATGIPRDEYSVTIPPYADGNPRIDNGLYSPKTDKLGLLNVGYIVSEFEMSDPDLNLVKEIEGSFIYENANYLPRAWIASKGDNLDSMSQVDFLAKSPNHLVLSATGPGSLTVSEIDYPGWQAKVDGHKETILTRDGVLMGVDLTPGKHEIEFSFRPRSVTIGVVLFFFGLAGLAVSLKKNYSI